MPQDIKYNFVLMDIDDLVLVDDCSEQNASMFLLTKNVNPLLPLLGVKVQGIREGNQTDLLNKLNKWKKQVFGDGASQANYTIDIKGNFTIAAKY